MIELQDVTANYGTLAALSDISLSFAEREKVAVFGHKPISLARRSFTPGLPEM